MAREFIQIAGCLLATFFITKTNASTEEDKFNCSAEHVELENRILDVLT